MPSNPKTGAAAPITTTPLPPGASALTGVPAGPALSNPAPTPAPISGPVGPGGGPDSGPGGSPGDGSPDPGPGGGSGSGSGTGSGPGGAPSPGDTTGQSDGSGDFDTKIGDSLLSLIASATSGDALEAQNIILRRIALAGDVVPGRVDPPNNISAVGCYINLLRELKQTDMLNQVLASILGVAGPTPAIGWTTNVTPLSFVPLANDRPAGPAQPTLPVTIPVRSDFVDTLRAALKVLHDQGCVLPLLGTPASLPLAGTNSQAPADVLPYLGRVLLLAANTALTAPATDVLLLARNQGSSDPYQIAANALGSGPVAVTPANYEALGCTTTACTSVSLTGAKLVYLTPVMANAGFYPASPPPQPSTSADAAWARLTNITGLVAGSTRFGDELSLLYPGSTVSNSVFSGMMSWLWNGTAFAPPA
ncbi:MAG TPA: hypothetical protein VM659_20395 [Dongiaceae bacterium]|nr:hypothetical protein [Dongiaceae bacterium]